MNYSKEVQGAKLAKSQNNRAFRSNPNKPVKNLHLKKDKYLCHKITEPSAQIPTGASPKEELEEL